jgi:CCR4-NOT transcription complex subunit 2
MFTVSQDLSGSSQRGLRADGFTEQESSQTQQIKQRQTRAGVLPGETQESSAPSQSTEQPPLSQMSELDRFGLAGLLRMIHSESPDVASLAVGQDLMTLGLDLNQPEYVVRFHCAVVPRY